MVSVSVEELLGDRSPWKRTVTLW